MNIRDDNLDALIKALNMSDRLSGEEFNRTPFIVVTYIKVYGQEAYNKCLAQKHYRNFNAFYHILGSIEQQITYRNIPTKVAKYYIDQIKNKVIANHALLFVVETAIKRNEIEYAEEMICFLSDDSPVSAIYHGYRMLLKFYALKADLDNFRKYLKLSKPAKLPKNQVIEYKRIMLTNYSENNGVGEGLKLCKEKIFGFKLCMSIIDEQAKKFSIIEINDILENHPVFLEYEPNAKAVLYVKRFNPFKQVPIPEEEFETTLKEIAKVDKSIKNGGVRLKDYLLFDLGSSSSNEKQITVCKKMITAPFYKKELGYLLN